MKPFHILAAISLVLLLGCKEDPINLEPYLVDVSEFHINNELLKDGDYVKVLGCSGNVTVDHEINFYNLVVVRSEKTGDTINVLVTNFFDSDLNNPRTRFISNSSDIGKLVEIGSEIKEMKGFKIQNLKAKSFSKVLYDTEYIQEDVRRFPAVTGNLGDYTIEGDLNNIDL